MPQQQKRIQLIKKVSYSLLCMLIGIALTMTYLFFNSQQYTFSAGSIGGNKVYWSPYPDNEAIKIMAAYRKEQNGIWLPSFRLRTRTVMDKEELLRGFWLDTAMLNDIQDSLKISHPNSKLTGYHVYFGKHTEARDRHYSLVVRASIESFLRDSKGRPISEGAGDYFDFVDPCPDNCGEGELEPMKKRH